MTFLSTTTCLTQQLNNDYGDTSSPSSSSWRRPAADLAWSRLNRIINADTWKKTREVGVKLGNLCAEIAKFQVMNGNHYIAEQPQGSELFGLRQWEELFHGFPAYGVIVDQRMLGLKRPLPPRLPGLVRCAKMEHAEQAGPDLALEALWCLGDRYP